MKSNSYNELLKVLGHKVRTIRKAKKLTLKQLSKLSHLSVSYLSEIESGKKYPSPDIILQIADTLTISYDDLVSTRKAEDFNPILSFVQTEMSDGFPFQLFGLENQSIIGLIKQEPNKVSAIIRTLFDISKIYDVRVEHFLFAALRTYQKLHQNYFEELEQIAKQCISDFQLTSPLKQERVIHILSETYGYKIAFDTFKVQPELRKFRSIFTQQKNPTLKINQQLYHEQKTFALAKELGFASMQLKERPMTSTWFSVTGFDEVLNNYRASYFAGALLLQKDLFSNEIKDWFKSPSWSPQQFYILCDKYHVMPETILYRLSELIPHIFGFHDLYLLRFQHKTGSHRFVLTKEFNMSPVSVPHSIGLNEHYCRRWLSIQLLQSLSETPTTHRNDFLVSAQKSFFVESNSTFFTITISRPLSLKPGYNTSMSIGFLMSDEFKLFALFSHDESVPMMKVNETCERCGLTAKECDVRAADPIHYQSELEDKQIGESLKKLRREK